VDVAFIVCKIDSVKSRLDLSELEYVFLCLIKENAFPTCHFFICFTISGHKQLSLSQVTTKNY
jgi:hypothetical protein